MARLAPVNPDLATDEAKHLLARVRTAIGFTPNMMRTMATAPAVLEGYLGLSGALAKGALPARLREQIALAVADANGCDYCLAAHSTVGKMVGLTQADVVASRRVSAEDPKAASALAFARAVLDRRGAVTDEALQAVRAAGFDDAQIAEIVAAVALNVFTNYFNNVARTEIDF